MWPKKSSSVIPSKPKQQNSVSLVWRSLKEKKSLVISSLYPRSWNNYGLLKLARTTSSPSISSALRKRLSEKMGFRGGYKLSMLVSVHCVKGILVLSLNVLRRVGLHSSPRKSQTSWIKLIDRYSGSTLRNKEKR